MCIIRHGYYPADPRVRKEAEALVAEEFEVDVICLKNLGEKSRESVRGVNVCRLPLGKRRKGIARYIIEYVLSFILFAVAVSFLYFKKRYAVIQVNTMPDFLVFATLVPKLCGTKVVLDMHEAMPELLRSKFALTERHPLTKLVALSECLSMRYANRILVVGESVLQLYIGRGLSRSKTVMIPNIPDDYLFDHEKYRNREASVGKKEFVLISHGSVLKRYGYQVLLKAVPHLKQSIPNVKVIIIGDGEYMESVKELAAQLCVQNHVGFMGRIPIESVPVEISQADIGIVPLIRDEFADIMAPNKLFEYVAMKKPVIASRTKGIQDFFDGSCVMFFESEDEQELARCIVELYKEPDKADKLVENAWLRYEKIRWRETKQTYCRVFTELSQNH